ncbi:stressosome-associated protein Prli42 [Paenibacillus melissococcoides]|uniref:Stressosome-associated protein Prli42 n=1 Tax=Paenibacillus melissococcoides TaxID=2912268 RepID=A0ABM9G1S9_9BACL|nr:MULTISPECIES: stressosome-associated protein Prli42 [Paenibacillus]MEB9897662.1 stressosome-associated protein Prli42 [Bacillus cereus]CAH8245574.1 stressosome-associated protein Prli42 [Paenibacillus melissococcoides]CAH8711351.1 stressosome-associated protein Prli42 [Paenibacillus melissococcoides]CAH8712116.1 stressosome-associated protein Prli42 [Paenibacillus melissococcoides]CAH8771543.1 stressosome-associated protein Prli42 [Paenibacillus dendritiformis]
MQSKKWFKIIVYLMLAAMLVSTVLVLIEPLLYG